MLIKRWKIKDVKDERGCCFTISIDHQQLPNGNKYYKISSSNSGEVTEEFAKKLIPVMTEDLERGGGEIWLDKEGNERTGMTLNYIEGKILKPGWKGEERRRKKRNACKLLNHPKLALSGGDCYCGYRKSMETKG